MAHSERLKDLHQILPIVMVGIICLNLFFQLFSLRTKYLTFDYWQKFPGLEHRFLDSQYVNKHPIWIRDEVAFSYSGGKLITGTNPVLVVPDAPPLGKYLIGLSIILFNNDSIIIIISAVASLVLLYFLGMQVFKNKSLALIPPLALSFERIFVNQLIYTPLMDIIQLVFFLSALMLFNRGLQQKKSLVFFLLANIFLGFFIATKFFVSGVTIIAAWVLILLLHRDIKRLLNLILAFPASIFILLLSYSWVFAFGYTFNKFLGIQKWVYLYHKSFLILPFSVWPLLLLNKWYVWFGDKPVITDGQWSVSWPIITILSLATIVLYVLKKIPRNSKIEVLMCWFIVYMLFLSVGQTFSRYFVILIPILYIITLYGIISVVRKKT